MARGAYGVAVVMAIAVAALMFSLSGYAGLYGGDPTTGLGQSQSALEDTAANESVEGGVGGQISGQDPSLVSLTVNGASSVASVLAFIVLLPISLQNLGFPFWFSFPIGLVVQLMGFISMVQFVSGRVLR